MLATEPHQLRIQGFTLIELIVVISVIAVLTPLYLNWKASITHESIVKRTVNSVEQINEALYAYRTDQQSWPASIVLLVDYLPSLRNVNAQTNSAGVNGAGLPFRLESNGQSIVIATRMNTRHQAREVALSYPNTGTFDPNTFDVKISLPTSGLERAYLQHDGSVAMTGNLDLDDNSIENAATISTKQLVLTEPKQLGAPCTTGSIATTQNGELLSCVNGAWKQ
jgi:prepilin-type N-terminal cleavage/methylation domain-containing protein